VKIVLLATDAHGGYGGIALFNRDVAAALAAMGHEILVVPRIVPHEPRGVPAGVTFLAHAASGPIAYAQAVARAAWTRAGLVVCGHVNLLPVAHAIGTRPLLAVYGLEAWRPPPSAASRYLLQRCRGIVCISSVTRDRLAAWSRYAGPLYLLPNAVHLDSYGIRPKRPDLVARYGLAGRRVLLTVGRLAGQERYKGFDEVLEVLGELPSDVVYLIAGGGTDAPRLRRRAVDLGVAARVVFTGIFPEEEKCDLYNLADVYVMPSRAEGFGFVFLEAMACGVPVIASKYDGGRDALLAGRLGTLVDPSNPAEVRAAIQDMLRNGQRRVPAELEHFSFANFRNRLEAIVESATSASSPATAAQGESGILR
jgi:phosphatidyl-myo-inositol dimannoside synthase